MSTVNSSENGQKPGPAEIKMQVETVEYSHPAEMNPETGKDAAPLMFSKEDDLTVWQSVRRYRMVGVIAMAAAFSASLDGYRKFQHKWFESNEINFHHAEINLNGGIVSNKGFIRQMATAGTTIIAGKYISAWGGIQATGQTIGQIVGSCLF
jgi:hypothetical protein